MSTDRAFLDKLTARVAGTPFATWLFLWSLLAFIIGINHLYEDWYSSFAGIRVIETDFGLKLQTHTFTYVTMSAMPSVASIILYYMFLSLGERKYLWLSLASQFIDILSDVVYRMNHNYTSFESLLVAFVITVVFFTLGSEVLLTLGFGVSFRLLRYVFTNKKSPVNSGNKSTSARKPRSTRKSSLSEQKATASQFSRNQALHPSSESTFVKVSGADGDVYRRYDLTDKDFNWE